MNPLFVDARQKCLFDMCSALLCYRTDKRTGRRTDVLNIADGGSEPSRQIAAEIARRIGAPLATDEPTSQTVGKEFTSRTAAFLEEAFQRLTHVRPGPWQWSTSQAAAGISVFDQYEHLAHLQSLLRDHPELKSALGGDYLITPDIIVGRVPLSDSAINANESLVSSDAPVARHTPLRARATSNPTAILHASISCKWTMRSDRAQNPRTEALNLIRNRKGNTPHIVVCTFEPLPTRLASIAMGTGDIDCTYHLALNELLDAADASKFTDQAEVLHELVEGRRLRDLSDLPFDLAV